MAILSPNIKLQLLTTGSFNVVKEVELNLLSKFIQQTFSQLEKPGDRDYETEELFKFEDVEPGDYVFGLTYNFGVVNDLFVTACPDGNTDSFIQIKKQNQAADFKVLDIPTNMPYGTDGVFLTDFIKGIQKKYNLVIYPSKTKQRQFIVEPYKDWIKNYRVKDWNKFVDLSQKMEVIPANNLGYKEVEFGDRLDVDYLADQFNKLNNREFGKSYYTDTENFYSQGKIQVETNFGVSPLAYVQGSGLSGSLNLTTGTLITVQYTDTFDVFDTCDAPVVNVYISAVRSNFITGDVIYTDQFLTQPLQGQTYIKNAGTADADKVIYAIDDSTGLIGSQVDNCDNSGGGGGGPTS